MKTILITGASAGLGAAMAKRLGRENKVVLLARRGNRLQQLQEEIGQNCIQILKCDVLDIETIKKELKEPHKIDVLINNAGLGLGLEPAYGTKIEDWERMIEVNILSLVRLTHFIAPFMAERGSGHIINIGSIAGTYPYYGGNVYGATKAFVKQFSLNLKTDLFDKNVRVTNIEPGLAETEFSITRFKGDVERSKEVYKGANALQPDDIALAVEFAINAPAHMNVNRMEIMPTTQASAGLKVHR